MVFDLTLHDFSRLQLHFSHKRITFFAVYFSFFFSADTQTKPLKETKKLNKLNKVFYSNTKKNEVPLIFFPYHVCNISPFLFLICI